MYSGTRVAFSLSLATYTQGEERQRGVTFPGKEEWASSTAIVKGLNREQSIEPYKMQVTLFPSG
jgi:hypothetical protein